MDDIVAQLVPMFVEDAREKTQRLAEAAEHLPTFDRKSEAFLDFLRTVHSLKGSATTFGFPYLGVICHRLEDYLAKTPHISPRAAADVRLYVDHMQEIAARGTDPTEAQGFALFQKLPHPPEFGDALAQQALYALFIGPRDVQFRILEAELRACGIRSTNAPNSFHGIELAVRTRPDFIMVANVVDVLEGLEIVRMLRAVRRLQATPLLFLMTELADPRARQALRDALPPDVVIVRKGRAFADDFANALTRLKIL